MRVEFFLTHYALACGAVIGAASAAFGERVTKHAASGRTIRVRCTSEQFVFFLVERNRLGGKNSWQDLNVQLFEAPRRGETETYVDVSND